MKKNNNTKLKKGVVKTQKKVTENKSVMKKYKRQDDEQLKLVAMSVLCGDTKTTLGKESKDIGVMFPAIVEYEEYIEKNKIKTMYSHRVNLIGEKDGLPVFGDFAFLNSADTKRLIKYIGLFKTFKDEI